MTRSASPALIHMRIAPKLRANLPELQRAIDSMVALDPSLSYVMADDEAIVLGGNDEAQLDDVIKSLGARGIDLHIGAPEAAYRETITRKTSADYTHKRQQFGDSQFARVILEAGPNSRDGGFSFKNHASKESIPSAYVAGVERGVRSLLHAGPIMGMPVVDIRVVLLDGAFHETNSSVATFEIAARAAFKEALALAFPILLEPVMNVTVTTPAEAIGHIIGNMNTRRGVVTGAEDTPGGTVITAQVPLANLFGYGNFLAAATSGRGRFTQSYLHYAAVPQSGDDPGRFPPAVGMRM
ncbi:hypothetical protein [Aestuariivirga sp.]|uniref:hypothetical protein n=1 Tax=Aestuariivirga sp. TaxID=2650926 RepID=UPI0039E53D41